MIASLQAIEAIKLLSGNRDKINSAMTVVDLWTNQFRSIGISATRNADCKVCGKQDFAWLEGRRGSAITRLCGRNSVQISPASSEPVDLVSLSERLAELGEVTTNPYLVRLASDGYLITIFADGRVIVGGTDDEAVARSLHAKFLGS